MCTAVYHHLTPVAPPPGVGELGQLRPGPSGQCGHPPGDAAAVTLCSQPLPRDQTLYRHWCIDVIYKNGSVCQLPLGILTAATGLWTYWLLHTASPSPYIYGLIDNCWPELNRDTKCVISIENKLEF